MAGEVLSEVFDKARHPDSATLLRIGDTETRVIGHSEHVFFAFEVAPEFQKRSQTTNSESSSSLQKAKLVEHSATCSQVLLPLGSFARTSFAKPVLNATALRHRIPEACLRMFSMRQEVELSPKGRRLLVLIGENRMRNLVLRLRLLLLRFVSLDAVSEILEADRKLIHLKKELDVYRDFESWESIRASAAESRALLTERWSRYERLRDSCRPDEEQCQLGIKLL
ncbi:hypothetical protein QR680_012716 [Steinernema hermaphroditum]|uniref:Uncharacterized protein n=1 Tax=Steinernema hermaphroditum TaxID=289476 RepID=A0AA39I586_9BILA|nr:hypothetical protein QR680_012716 [Steinernema hermaphroditum]